MAEYLVSFRVGNVDSGLTANERWRSIEAPLKGFEVWKETTSLLIVRTSSDIFQVIKALAGKLDARFDMMLVRQIGVNNTLFWGAVEDSQKLMSLVPDARRVTF